MNSISTEISKEILTNFNDRLVKQNIIISTLCKILIENDIIGEDALLDRINADVDEFNKMLETMAASTTNDEFEGYAYYGPPGEA